MKTWQIEDFHTMRIVDSDTSTQLSPGFARVKVTNVAINPADLSVFDGKLNVKYPLVPARLATGLVSEAIDSNFNKGQRVLITSYLQGKKKDNGLFGINKDGLLAEYVTVPNSALYALSNQFEKEEVIMDDDASITNEEALFVEDIAMCINVLSKIELHSSEYIVLMGASYLNCIMAELAIYRQAVPIIIDNDSSRLDLAERIGCYYIINTQEENALQKIMEITSGRMADSLVFDTDSFSNTADIGLYLKKRGKACLYGYNVAIDKLNADLAPILRNELNVSGETSAEGAIC